LFMGRRFYAGFLVFLVLVGFKVGRWENKEMLFDGENWWRPVDIHYFADGHYQPTYYWNDENWGLEGDCLWGEDFTGASNAYFTRRVPLVQMEDWLMESKFMLAKDGIVQFLNRDSANLTREGGASYDDGQKKISLFCWGDISFEIKIDLSLQKNRWYTIWVQKLNGRWKLHVDGKLLADTGNDMGNGTFAEPHYGVFGFGKAYFAYFKLYEPAGNQKIHPSFRRILSKYGTEIDVKRAFESSIDEYGNPSYNWKHVSREEKAFIEVLKAGERFELPGPFQEADAKAFLDPASTISVGDRIIVGEKEVYQVLAVLPRRLGNHVHHLEAALKLVTEES